MEQIIFSSSILYSTFYGHTFIVVVIIITSLRVYVRVQSFLFCSYCITRHSCLCTSIVTKDKFSLSFRHLIFSLFRVERKVAASV